VAANEYRDRVVDEVTDKVLQRPGTDVGEEQVREAAEAAVHDLAAAPVQTFTPAAGRERGRERDPRR